jgi:hypothetical protein
MTGTATGTEEAGTAWADEAGWLAAECDARGCRRRSNASTTGPSRRSVLRLRNGRMDRPEQPTQEMGVPA